MGQSEALRVLDACANRAAEGLRTIEDVARLVREDAWSAEQVKLLRHELGAVVAGLPRLDRLAARSTATDVGTELHAPRENRRADWPAIVSAAAERTSQSLRSLEEFSKVVDANIAQQFKQLRYRAYDLLAEIEIRLINAPRKIGEARLYLLVDCQQPIERFEQSLKALAEAGVDWFQIRDKQVSDLVLLKYARAAVAAARVHQASVIVNDRPDIALLSGAAGVHVGQDDLPIEEVRRIVRHKLWVGVSTHSTEQVQDAQERGADYIGCGPTFPSKTKSFSDFPGIEFIRRACQVARVPAFALGGIDARNLDQVMEAGCQRVAVSAAIQAASDPVAAAAELAERLRGARSGL